MNLVADETWLKIECERVANDEVWIGMDIMLLAEKRGNPTSINESNYGNGTQYQ